MFTNGEGETVAQLVEHDNAILSLCDVDGSAVLFKFSIRNRVDTNWAIGHSVLLAKTDIFCSSSSRDVRGFLDGSVRDPFSKPRSEFRKRYPRSNRNVATKQART